MRLLFAPVFSLALWCSAFGQTYTIRTVAGGSLPVNLTATSASLGTIGGLTAVESGSSLFIAARDYNIVLRLDTSSGQLTLVAGNGTAGFSGDGGPATSAQLYLPENLAVDPAGNLYIVDIGNNRIREVSNGVITTVAGNGTYEYSGDGGPATSAGFIFPQGLAVDAAGNLYISDNNNGRIRKVSNGVISTVAGNGTFGFSGDGGTATSAQLNFPSGITVDSGGNLYIADTENQRVRKVSNGVITTVAGTGSAGFSGDGGPAINAQLFWPQAVGVDASGNLFIVDRGNNRVRKVSQQVMTTVAGTGVSGFSGDGGSAIGAKLNAPWDLTLDSSGNLYIDDLGNDRIRQVSNGMITTIAGNGTGDSGDGGPATSAQLDIPEGIAIDSSGNFFIADIGNNCIRKVSNGVIATMVGTGVAGFGGDGGPPASAQLYSPRGVVVDSSGNLYIADTGNERIREVSGGVITTVAGNGNIGFSGDGGPPTSAQLKGPISVAVDPSGNLYIADHDNNRIREVSHGVITTVAGDGIYGFSGDGGPATAAQLNGPNGVAVDSLGNLYIADGNGRIRMVSGGVITTVAGGGTTLGDGGPATSAQLTGLGVAVDRAGNIYIADGERVRRVSGGVIMTIAGGGTTLGDNGPATNAQFGQAWSLALDSSGDIYVADDADDRVRVLTASGPPCTYTVNPSQFTASASAGSLAASIQTNSACAWAIQGLPDWITFSGNAVSSGPGTLSLTVAANTGPARSAQISIAGLSVTVNQASGVLLVNTGGVVDGASYTAPVVPGSIAAIFGNFLLPAPVEVSAFPVPTNLGGLSFQFSDGTLAPLFYANVGQANAQVPWELEGQLQTTITATINGQTSASQTVSLATYAPGIFAVNSEGTGQGAILDANYHLVDASNPAIPGQTTILIYCTGLGPVSSNQPATGAPASLTNLAHTSSPVTATIGGVSANVTFSGLAPGYVGLYQVNAQVPGGVPANSAAPVMISIEGASSNTVTIAVQ